MEKRNLAMLRYLKDRGADLNVKPRFGDAPLLWAVAAPHYIDSKPSDQERAKSDDDYLPIVEFLLKSRVDTTVTDDRGRSALQVAESARHPKIATLLRKNGLHE
jgi:ankyrin repeat protein